MRLDVQLLRLRCAFLPACLPPVLLCLSASFAPVLLCVAVRVSVCPDLSPDPACACSCLPHCRSDCHPRTLRVFWGTAQSLWGHTGAAANQQDVKRKGLPLPVPPPCLGRAEAYVHRCGGMMAVVAGWMPEYVECRVQYLNDRLAAG